jgi:predicted PurR-regulated permease PerM
MAFFSLARPAGAALASTARDEGSGGEQHGKAASIHERIMNESGRNGALMLEGARRGRSDRIGLWLGVIACAVVLHLLRWILMPFLIAGVIAYLCMPLVDRLARRVSRSVAVGAVFLCILAMVLAIALLGAPPMMRELTHLITDMQHTFETLAKSIVGDRTVSLLGQATDASQLAQTATQGIREWVEQPERMTELGAASFAAAFSMVLTLVLLFYFLWGGRRILEGALWLASSNERSLIREIWRRFDPVLWRYFMGVVVVIVYATIAAYVGLGLVLGIRHAAFLALTTGLLEMIPVVGPAASAVIAGLVAVRHATGIGPIVAYAIYAVALRLSIDQLLGPLVLGAAAQLHPVLIIFSFLAGGALFGLPGIILAAPMILALKVTLQVIREGDPGEATGPKAER